MVMRHFDGSTLRSAGLALALAGCNAIAGIDDPIPRESGGGQGGSAAVACATIDDCTVEEPDCRSALACEQGACVFSDEPDGTPLAQVAGDCAERVCDGAGHSKLLALATDIPDDGNACTLDACNGTTPTHTPESALPCYTGPAATRGVGICADGFQSCDADGNPVGGCEGETLPGTETCVSPLDEDCDGKANEEGEACSCVPGAISDCYTGPVATLNEGACHGGMQSCNAEGLGYGPCVGEQTPEAETCDPAMIDEDCDGQLNEEGADCLCGDGIAQTDGDEECDDGNLISTDGCTVLCKLPACGDGFVQGSEECDDGNMVSTDGCTVACENAACGDGFVQAGEECDDGNLISTDACTVSCTDATCGDGFVQPGLNEQCDDGNLVSTDACTALCEPAACGDGIVQPVTGETCDDGGTSDGDTCSPICKEQKVLQIDAGNAHTCALLSGGAVKCWGANQAGSLGQGDTVVRGNQPNQMGDNLPLVNLGPGNIATSISAGSGSTCALFNAGKVKCWGSNTNGALGLGDSLHRGDAPGEMGDNLPFVDLGTNVTATAISVGTTHACAILSGGAVKCWGFNIVGQLGLGDTNNRGDQPGEMGDNLPTVNLGTGKTAVAISAGNGMTCAILNDATLKCWGQNGTGGLGQGDTITRGDQPGEMGDNLPPVNLGAGKSAVAVATGNGHTCAILNDATLKCWGSNFSGMLGLGHTNNISSPQAIPVNLGTGKTAVAVSVSNAHTCALLNDNSVKCWGYNASGQLGRGHTNSIGDNPGEMGDALPPVDLGAGKTALGISADGSSTCALSSDSTGKCWGWNSSGQLGLGDVSNRGDQPGEMGDSLPTVKLFSPQW